MLQVGLAQDADCGYPALMKAPKGIVDHCIMSLSKHQSMIGPYHATPNPSNLRLGCTIYIVLSLLSSQQHRHAQTPHAGYANHAKGIGVFGIGALLPVPTAL